MTDESDPSSDEGSKAGEDREDASAEGTAAPPRVVLAEELASIRDLSSRASAFVSLPEPSVLVDDVRSRPLEERYRSAAVAHAERLGVDQRTLDSLLRLSVDEGEPATVVADRLDVDPTVVRRVQRWCSTTRHKRHSPSKPSMGT